MQNIPTESRMFIHLTLSVVKTSWLFVINIISYTKWMNGFILWELHNLHVHIFMLLDLVSFTPNSYAQALHFIWWHTFNFLIFYGCFMTFMHERWESYWSNQYEKITQKDYHLHTTKKLSKFRHRQI